MSLYSYVVRYDSGFAPNPFYGYCTLANCKPDIRRKAQLGDWIVGCGSAAKAIGLGGHLVYAMRVTGTPGRKEYWDDARFLKKRPMRQGSRKQSCGDNIYYPLADETWGQMDSFHSLASGLPNLDHVNRDTSVDRVLISDDFVYFGGDGPIFPAALRDFDGIDVCKAGIGWKRIEDADFLEHFGEWVSTLGNGLCGFPQEWRAQHGN